MATVLPAASEVLYPDSDGRPMGETPRHVRNLSHLVYMLDMHFANEPQVFVAGNMFVYWTRGDRYKYVTPDVFVVRGIPRQGNPERRRYLVWEEGKSPDTIIELTSESTLEEDIDDKMAIYRDTMRVPEYFLFDLWGEYLAPPLQGHRLVDGKYERIEPIDGRLPSVILGLHLEANGAELRLYDPVTKQYLKSPPEEHAARQQAEIERQKADADRRKAESERRKADAERQEAETERNNAEVQRKKADNERKKADAERQKAEAENERLRREIEELRRRLSDQS